MVLRAGAKARSGIHLQRVYMRTLASLCYRLTLDASSMQCATCPDPSNCARLLDEKWRHGYQSLFRFGPPQPSMVFRYLRSLEAPSPPLAMSHYSCQTHAKAWTVTREFPPTGVPSESFFIYFFSHFLRFLLFFFFFTSFVRAWVL